MEDGSYKKRVSKKTAKRLLDYVAKLELNKTENGRILYLTDAIKDRASKR